MIRLISGFNFHSTLTTSSQQGARLARTQFYCVLLFLPAFCDWLGFTYLTNKKHWNQWLEHNDEANTYTCNYQQQSMSGLVRKSMILDFTIIPGTHFPPLIVSPALQIQTFPDGSNVSLHAHWPRTPAPHMAFSISTQASGVNGDPQSLAISAENYDKVMNLVNHVVMSCTWPFINLVLHSILFGETASFCPTINVATTKTILAFFW